MSSTEGSRFIRCPTRRSALAALAVSGLAPAALASDAVDRLGVPGPIEFAGTS